MGNQTGVILTIFVGVVGTIVLFGFISNTIEWYFSGLKKIADDYPQQPVRTDGAVLKGEHLLAVTKEQHTTPPGRGFNALGCLSMVGAVALVGIAAGFFFAFFGGSPAAAGTLWIGFFAVWALAGFVWFSLAAYRVITAKAWHRIVEWQADDDHLHVRAVTSIGAPNATISIPWTVMDPMDLDPNAGTFMRAPVGGYWLHADRAMFHMEIEVRGGISRGSAPFESLDDADPSASASSHYVDRSERAPESAGEAEGPRDHSTQPPAPGRSAQDWDDLMDSTRRSGGRP